MNAELIILSQLEMFIKNTRNQQVITSTNHEPVKFVMFFSSFQ